MNKQALLPIIFLISIITSAQNVLKSDALYADQTPMEIKLSYSNKGVNKNTWIVISFSQILILTGLDVT